MPCRQDKDADHKVSTPLLPKQGLHNDHISRHGSGDEGNYISSTPNEELQAIWLEIGGGK